MGLAVSYCDDYFYIPIERQVMLRDELAQLLLNGCHGKLLHTNVTYEKKSNSDHDGSYSLVENWFVPNISIAKCLEANGSINNNGNIYSSTSMINGF
ncbi:unnamed protein product [Rotaria magnacalcarata]|nr:unnamed protein product [Rotaria magnacalcarata]